MGAFIVIALFLLLLAFAAVKTLKTPKGGTKRNKIYR